MIWLIYVLVTLVISYAVIFAYKTKTGSPYLPSEDGHIKCALKYIRRGDVVADLGCGDGRVLIEAVKAGAAEGHGWEIEPHVYVKAKQNVKRAGLEGKVFIYFGDMWRTDLSKYDLVFIYQLERFAERFVRKFKQEMKKGSLVIANTYPLAKLVPEKVDGKLYLYRV